MGVLADLAQARADAEALMLDSCTIDRPGQPVTDAAGVVTVPTTQVYAGKCKVQTYEAYESHQVAGGRTHTVQRYRVDIPTSAPAVEPGDVVTITGAAAEPRLLGNTYRVAGSFAKSLATAQRVPVEEVTG